MPEGRNPKKREGNRRKECARLRWLGDVNLLKSTEVRRWISLAQEREEWNRIERGLRVEKPQGK